MSFVWNKFFKYFQVNIFRPLIAVRGWRFSFPLALPHILTKERCVPTPTRFSSYVKMTTLSEYGASHLDKFFLSAFDMKFQPFLIQKTF